MDMNSFLSYVNCHQSVISVSKDELWLVTLWGEIDGDGFV